MSELITLPKEVQEQVDALIAGGHPLTMSVSSTKFLAKKYEYKALADFLDDPANAGDYISYVMTQQ